MKRRGRREVTYGVWKALDDYWDYWDGPYSSERKARKVMEERGPGVCVMRTTHERLPSGTDGGET